MKLSIIVAASLNDCIGVEGRLPWQLPKDLQRFKRLTMGHPIIMGRRTFQSIGRVLPGRSSIIISRNPDFRVDGAVVASGFDHALKLATGDDHPFVIGGAEVFRKAFPVAQLLYLTRVQTRVRGDTFLPDNVVWSEWNLLETESHVADSENEFGFSFETYQRGR